MYVATPPPAVTFLAFAYNDPGRLARILKARDDVPGGYSHWDRVRHLAPPDGLTTEEWWAAIKLSRARYPLPLRAVGGMPMTYGLPDEVQRLLHLIDQQCAGRVAMDEVVTSQEQARQHYLVNSLMEEAIRSSQLEGASTTRQVAKELLRSGREPIDRNERMILNNYRALSFMHEQGDGPLTPDLVLELHRILVAGTLDEAGAAGRLQRPDEVRVAVYDGRGRIVHAPPPAEDLPGRLRAMCEFANEPIDGERFIHPVVRAILLHFWLAYDHPFLDGNGRTARALFYWYMRTHGYWLVEYLSISRILREAPANYARAFLYTETDDGDTTYFLLHQLQVIGRAVHEFHAYLRRKMHEVRDIESMVPSNAHFNHRQLALLSDALRHPDRVHTLGAHAREHRVTHETARTDFAALLECGLLVRTQRGRTYRFSAPPDLERRLRALGSAG